MKQLITALFLLFFIGNISAQKPKTKKDKRTPFTKVRYQGKQPLIEVEGDWVAVKAISGIPITNFIDLACEWDADDWQRNFHRYLHYLMDDMEFERGDTLQVTFLQNKQLHKRAFKLKNENRELATAFHDSIVRQNRVLREHSGLTPPSLQYLQKRLDGYTPVEDSWLTAEEAIHDLEYLEWEIETNYSYAQLKSFDFARAFDAIRNDLRNGISKRDFSYQLKMLMANFGDGHSRVSIQDVIRKEEWQFLPFKIIRYEHKFYAVDIEKKDFYNPDFPEIKKLNGIAIETLYKLCELLVAKTTPDFVRRNAVSYLNCTGFVLKMAGEDYKKPVTVDFGNGQSISQTSIALRQSLSKKSAVENLLKDTLFHNNIGYLGIRIKMDDEDDFINGLHNAMEKFKQSKGLIIDVRGNSGGSRHALKVLLPYFIKSPKVVNVSRFRIDQEAYIKTKSGYLQRRFMIPEDAAKASYPALISDLKKGFDPQIKVSDQKFSEYHYMVVDPKEDVNAYYYDKPVWVLIDEGCFSATDIFAAGIRQGDQVQLLGNTTGGGSGYSKSKYLPNSKIKVRLSRMFSYQPDGNLYDGHGVVPDVKVVKTLDDLLEKSDGQLAKALSLLEHGSGE